MAEIDVAAADARPFGIIHVDDGSTDATATELSGLMAQRPWLRQIWHAVSCGQSAAIRTGLAARAPIVVTLDGGQNDPTFIPALIHALEKRAPRGASGLGERVQKIPVRALPTPCRDPARWHPGYRPQARGVSP